jgi:arylformamidase
MALFDISREISADTAVWPGDQEVEWTWTARVGENDSPVNLGAIHLSTHTATHADAPLHAHSEGTAVDALPLEAFVGPAQVIELDDHASEVRPHHVADLRAERVLFKTAASNLPDEEWPDAVVPISPETISHLSQAGVVLIGTDAPSVDPLDSTDLPAHHALRTAGIVNLEGLSLRDVSPGLYELMALPLKIDGGDAAPVRAVLRTDP